MKIEEFNEETNKLERFYDKEIPEEQKKIWYRELQNLDLSRFKYIIAQVYRTSKFLPKLADILEINTKLGYSQMQKEKSINNCKKCNGTGYIIYKKVDKNSTKNIVYDYVAICSCRSQPQYKGWEITDKRYKSNYYTPYIEEIIH